MKTLLVTQAEVPKLLPMNECIEVMASTMAELARGETILPLRSILWLPGRVGGLGLMPGALLPEQVLGLKAITFFPGNEGTPIDTHQGAVLLFEAEHGRLLAVIDATSITAIRTAAVSAVATRALAREEAGDLAILGAGVQARTHLEAMRGVRRIRRVRVASRRLESAQAFARRESKRQGIAIEAVASPREAVLGADLICTTTSAREPILAGDWIAPGAHVNAVGSSIPAARELDTAAVARARLYADRRESVLNEAGDFLIAKAEGAVVEGHIVGEIGEVLIGKTPGRRCSEEITLFKSLGLAVEDVASARHIYDKATKTGAGMFLDFGGKRDEGD
ncbi:MAG TPA: ornithine cyclodeaminase family protein [Thermoanaerobaculia bacterium]|nr:ornithine cyclodeaminase family protein [Thermoanaerobaculia bacterium]